jgi:hypothetical protein
MKYVTMQELLLSKGSADTPTARQPIRNRQQWSTWEEMFSTRSLNKLCDETRE